jgi:hypothetical protein
MTPLLHHAVGHDQEKIKEDEKVAFNNADFASDVQQAAQQNAMNQNDYSKTYSNDQLDSMEWKGDENSVWNIGGINISRKDAFGAGKKARDNWANSNDAKAMSPEDRAKVDQQFSQYLQAIKNNDPAKAKSIYDQMPPSAQGQIEARNENIVGAGVSASVQNDARSSIGTSTSTNSRADAIESTAKNCATNNLSMGASCEGGIEAAHRPTSAFNRHAPPPIEASVAQPTHNVVNLEQRTEKPKIKLAELEKF